MLKKFSLFKNKRNDDCHDSDDGEAVSDSNVEASPAYRDHPDDVPSQEPQVQADIVDQDGWVESIDQEPIDDVSESQVLDDGPEFAGEMPDQPGPAMGQEEIEAEGGCVQEPVADPVYAHPAVVCRLYSQDYGNSFRIFDESVSDELKQKLLTCIYDSLIINGEDIHPIAVRRRDVILSGWLLTADVLSDRFNTDVVGRSKLPVFAGVTRPASAELLVPDLGVVKSIYEDGIEDIWTTGSINTHPPSVPFVLSPEDSLRIIGKGKVKVRSGLTIYTEHIPENDMEKLLKTDSWVLVFDVRDEKQARSMGATHCIIGNEITRDKGRNKR